ncbi:unnamed protein product [Rotaria sp. Silwood1]|nr:unnamed protein product [Rotaria sp. Silwood1]
MNRFKRNRNTNVSISSFEQLNERNKVEKSLLDRSNIKLKDKLDIESQYDELIIPNWTYSTDLGFVYNPIREKRMKVIKKTVRKKTKDFDSNVDSVVRLSHKTPNEIKLLDSTFSKSTIPISSKNIQHSSENSSSTRQQHTDNNSVHLISNDKSLLECKEHDILLHSYRQSFQNLNRFASSHYYGCDSIFNKKIQRKRQFSKKVFICKVHSLSWPESNRFKVNNELPYRMMQKGPQRLCQ